MSRARLVFVMLVLSVAINVVLAHKLRQFSGLTGKPTEVLRSGAVVPPLEAVDLNGKARTIAYDQVSQPTVLYIFTPPCSWCTRNMNNLKTLLDKDSGQYRFIGLSLSDAGLMDYVTRNELKLPVYSGLSTETLKSYKLMSTPQTIVVSPEGRVLQNWVGAYVGEQKSQVEAFFHVALPGVTAAPK